MSELKGSIVLELHKIGMEIVDIVLVNLVQKGSMD